ncbi:MAG: hypothetical protein LBB89_11175 [Treponema sp.]|jgi:hypothetical protein|nr:hypothetical protein [Treponema sp.]
MMTAEEIKEKQTVEDFKKMIEFVYEDRFDKYFEYISSEICNFEDIFSAYIMCRNSLKDNLVENLYFFSSGCTFESYNLTTGNGTPITEESDRDDVFNALNKDFEDRLQKLDMMFLQYAEKYTGTLDFSIKEFPKDADNNEKEILNKLSKEFKIQRTLSANGKYDMCSKRQSKAIARFLLSIGINDTWGTIFMNKYINHDVERSTLVNYFNECPKDMPRKQ